MKILELCAYFYPNLGGIESIIKSLASQWVKKSHKVKVIASNNKDRRFKIEGVEVEKVRSFTVFNDPVAYKLPFLLLKEVPKYDVVHIHHPHTFWVAAGSVICWWKNVPYFLHMHGRELRLKGLKGFILNIFNMTFLKFAISKARAIITHSESVLEKSRMLGNAEIIHHGVNIVKSNHGKKNKNIFTVGVRDYKRVDILIKAFKIVYTKFPDSRLIIVGDGNIISNLKKKALGLPVDFSGRISNSKLKELYEKSGAFALASPTIMESFGTAATDAISFGCPAVITSGAGAAVLFNKEKIGYVVKPKSAKSIALALINILNKQNIADKKSRLDKKKIEAYSWENQAKKYLELFSRYSSDKVLKKHYESESPFEMFSMKKASGYLKRRQFRYVMSQLKKKGRKILDLGCGPGVYSLALAKNNSVTAVDLAENMIESLKKKSNNISTLVAAADSTGLPSHSFDVILFLDVTHHLPISKLANIYKECSRLLKDNGLLITDFKNRNNLLINLSYKINTRPSFPLYARNLREMTSLLKKFKIIKMKGSFYSTLICKKK